MSNSRDAIYRLKAVSENPLGTNFNLFLIEGRAWLDAKFGANEVTMHKILFVDNDATQRIIAKKFIEGQWEGCKVFLAANGAEALKMAHKEQPNLILLDVMMPGLDGVETLKKLREQGNAAPVIFVTAKTEVADLMQNPSMGVVSVLQKPFVPRQLLEECSKVLDQKD